MGSDTTKNRHKPRPFLARGAPILGRAPRGRWSWFSCWSGSPDAFDAEAIVPRPDVTAGHRGRR